MKLPRTLPKGRTPPYDFVRATPRSLDRGSLRRCGSHPREGLVRRARRASSAGRDHLGDRGTLVVPEHCHRSGLLGAFPRTCRHRALSAQLAPAPPSSGATRGRLPPRRRLWARCRPRCRELQGRPSVAMSVTPRPPSSRQIGASRPASRRGAGLTKLYACVRSPEMFVGASSESGSCRSGRRFGQDGHRGHARSLNPERYAMTLLPDFGAATFGNSTNIDNTLFPLPGGTINSYGAAVVDPDTGEEETERNDHFATFETKIDRGRRGRRRPRYGLCERRPGRGHARLVRAGR